MSGPTYDGCGSSAPDPTRPGGTPFEEGAALIRTGRRTLITTGAGVAFSVVAGSAAAAPKKSRGKGKGQGKGKAKTTPPPKTPMEGAKVQRRHGRRCYVLVVDGCRPDEIDQGITPHLMALRDGGLRYPRATSMPVMETIPNHVMMMTGMRPDRTGVPANSVLDLTSGTVRDMNRSTDIKALTIIERMNERGLRTGTVLSKDYLYGVFGERAGMRWEPAPLLPVTNHAPDRFTMMAVMDMLDNYDPHLMFVNLGDIDRFGHADVTGPLGVKATRRAALVDTDLLIGDFVAKLKSIPGRWEKSMVIVLADHSMDFSVPTDVISLTAPLAADPVLAGNVVIAQNGGAELLYWRGAEAQRADAVQRMIAVATATPGVLEAHPRTDPALRLGPEAGDVLVYCQAGYRFSDPQPVSNPIPGNHGHPATLPIPFFVGGGHRDIPHGVSSSSPAATIDVAPTVADFFGIRAGRSSYDGTTRLRTTKRPGGGGGKGLRP